MYVLVFIDSLHQHNENVFGVFGYLMMFKVLASCEWLQQVGPSRRGQVTTMIFIFELQKLERL